VESDVLSPGAVSRRLGVAVTTLRTWHQRYGLGPSGHSLGAHRRYSEDDLARLETMRRLTTQGVPAAEAARIARTADRADMARLATASATPTDRSGPARLTARAPSRAGGGSAIPVGRAGASARGLAQAAMRLDAVTIREVIHRAIEENGVVGAWHDLLVPVLIGVGARHAATNRFIEVEHMLSRSVADVLGSVPRRSVREPIRTLLACAEEEQHSLPLEALAAALAERGVGCRMLGARTPLPALLDAVRRTGPSAVVVWSQTPETGDVGQLRALLEVLNRPALVEAAGPGWPRELPDGVIAPDGLADAIALIATTV
jgi:MerR family transcriptional regulator, light-induced transcriptional regulator